jgi:hypothetical protein
MMREQAELITLHGSIGPSYEVMLEALMIN